MEMPYTAEVEINGRFFKVEGTAILYCEPADPSVGIFEPTVMVDDCEPDSFKVWERFEDAPKRRIAPTDPCWNEALEAWHTAISGDQKAVDAFEREQRDWY